MIFYFINFKDPRTHDLAIYELETPVKFSKNIQPICLPKVIEIIPWK